MIDASWLGFLDVEGKQGKGSEDTSTGQLFHTQSLGTYRGISAPIMEELPLIEQLTAYLYKATQVRAVAISCWLSNSHDDRREEA